MKFAVFLLALVGSAEAFAPATASVGHASRRASSPVCLEGASRRQAVLGAGAVLAAAALPTAALADDTDDAMLRIAAKNKAALNQEKEKEKARIKEQIEKGEETSSDKFKKIAAIGAGGILASIPF